MAAVWRWPATVGTKAIRFFFPTKRLKRNQNKTATGSGRSPCTNGVRVIHPPDFEEDLR